MDKQVYLHMLYKFKASYRQRVSSLMDGLKKTAKK